MRLVLFPRLARQRQAAQQRSAGGATLEAQAVVRGVEAAHLGHRFFQGLVAGRITAVGAAVLQPVGSLVGQHEVAERRRARLLTYGVLALGLRGRHGVRGSGFGVRRRRRTIIPRIPKPETRTPNANVRGGRLRLVGLRFRPLVSRRLQFLSLFPTSSKTPGRPWFAEKNRILPQRTTDIRTSQSYFMPRV